MTPSPRVAATHAAVSLGTFAWAAWTGSITPLLWVSVVSFVLWVAWARGRWTPDGRFGLANAITAVRIALALAVGLLPTHALVPWAGIALAVFFTLDGVDGYVAQRMRTASAFGAAFDTEADAFMVGVACLAVVGAGLVGPWILAVGALRYLFVIVASVWTGRAEPRRRLARWAFSALMCGLSGALLLPNRLTVAVLIAGGAAVIVSFMRSFWWLHSAGADHRSD